MHCMLFVLLKWRKVGWHYIDSLYRREVSLALCKGMGRVIYLPSHRETFLLT